MAKQKSNETHALLSASGSHKWLHCPPSARLEEQQPETTSDYAEEGRLAHEICELVIRKHLIEPMGTKKFNNALKKLQEKPFYDQEMLSCAEAYKDFISGVVYGYSSKPFVAVEKRVDYSHVAPGGFGTCDCIIIGDNVLHIIDYKHGKGVPVSPFENPQMMLYALGALREYSLLYCIDTVRMTIVQPRLNSEFETYELGASDLSIWATEVQPIAQMAYDGKGDFKSGEHCRFCKVKATCRERNNTMTALEAFGGMKPPLISNAEVGEILEKAQTLKSWVTDLEEYALAEILKGNEIAGWKAVEGRSNRTFMDTDSAFDEVKKAGYKEELLYTRKPITLSEVEKLLGKKEFSELLSDHVIKPPGKPTLALLSDKREPINLKVTAAEAFTQ
ncbi:MAG: DUF2800 domain-containing protein [Oscillospiraceae bacterium]